MLGQIFATTFDGRKLIALPCSKYEWRHVELREILDQYENSDNLKVLARKLGIGVRSVRTALSLACIDYVLDLHRLHLEGRSCAKIARDNGMKPGTLAVLFADRGWKVMRGRSRRRFSQYELMSAAFRQKTINATAKELGVHWETAKSLLQRLGLIEAFGHLFQNHVDVWRLKDTTRQLEL